MTRATMIDDRKSGVRPVAVTPSTTPGFPVDPGPGHTDMDALARRLVDEAELTLRFVTAQSSSTTTTVLESVRDLVRDLSPGSNASPMSLNTGDDSQATLIEQLTILEDIKSAVAAAQARVTHAFIEARAEYEREAGIPLRKRGRGIGSEIALAKRQSPHAGSQATRMAYTLCEHMPYALAALTDGRLSEQSAGLVVKEVSALPVAAQTTIDAHMRTRYGHAVPSRLAGEVRALANQSDPAAQVKRREIAVYDRRVSVRPAPDSMAYLTALLPLEQAVACKKALLDASGIAPPDGARSACTRAQREADILVERLTGQATAAAVPVEVNLVMTAETLFGISGSYGTIDAETPGAVIVDPLAAGNGTSSHVASSHVASSHGSPTTLSGVGAVDDEDRLPEAIQASAWIPGHGPIAASVARDLLSPRHDDDSDHDTHQSRIFLRRVLTDPVSGDITATDTRRRAFTGSLRRALILRDDVCRTPWCGAPISHLDHTHPFARGGSTSAANGTGLCARCNYTKEYEGWHHRARSTDNVPSTSMRTVVTPTNHTYQSMPPPLLPDLTRRT